MTNFEFVNVDRPGDEKRHASRIRRHVMKDIGKARRKPKKPNGETTITRAMPVCRSQGQDGRAGVPSPLEGCELSEIVFPTEMDEERMNLARYLFAEARSSYRPFRFPWLSMGLSDAAAWHITMANAVIFRSMKPGDLKPEFFTNTEAMKWYTLSLKSISKRLADPTERNKEGLIVAIAGFICHDSSTGNFARQDIHMQGLKRLIDDQGGIDEITNPLLRFMISWHDLSGASYRNSTPYFKVPKGSITNIDRGNDSKYFEQLLESWDEKCPHLGDIRSALEATAAVASYVNKHCHAERFWTQDVLAARLLAPALHEVLSLEGRALPSDPSHQDYSGTAAREAFRRSLLIFLASIKAKFGAMTFELRRHLDDFRQITQIPHVEWTVVPELNLWAHTVAALQEETGGRRWHVSTIVGIMESMGFMSSRQALDVVGGIIWIEALFADEVETLCREIDDAVARRLAGLSLDSQTGDIIDTSSDERLAQIACGSNTA